MNQISKNNIQNTDNYNKNFQDLPNAIFVKYISIINYYLKHCLDNIFIQNEKYYIYVIKKGITTINHVFKMLLMYTKNLEIVYTNCQKSYIYYIEFIGQIGEDNHTFLQLNSKDAALFVYKKTIFDINNDIRKDYETDNLSNEVLDEVDSLIRIYNTILYKLIDHNSIINIIKTINTDLQNIMQKLIKLNVEKNTSNVGIISNKIESILIFSINFKQENLIDYLDIFIKKLKKKNIINVELLKHYLLQDELYVNTSPVKYINYIMSQI